MQDNYVIFEIDGTSYAAQSEQVVMLEMVESITHVPNAPEFVEGVAAIRGQIIPVVNVRRRFHMQMIPLDIRARLIVIRLGERQVGMLVDTAREYLRIPADQIHPAEGLTGPGVEYLAGVATLPGRVILLVNLERLLSFEERQTIVERPVVEDAKTDRQKADRNRADRQPSAALKAAAGAEPPAAKNEPEQTEQSPSPVDAAPRKRSRKG